MVGFVSSSISPIYLSFKVPSESALVHTNLSTGSSFPRFKELQPLSLFDPLSSMRGR